MGPGTCRKLRALWIMVDKMVSIMRAWGWDDLCKVMAAIQRLKRPRTTCSSQCALERPSSFLIQSLAPPWVEVVGLSNLASPPHLCFYSQGWGWLSALHPHMLTPPAAIPPACRGQQVLHHVTNFQVLAQYCSTTFWPNQVEPKSSFCNHCLWGKSVTSKLLQIFALEIYNIYCTRTN